MALPMTVTGGVGDFGTATAGAGADRVLGSGGCGDCGASMRPRPRKPVVPAVTINASRARVISCCVLLVNIELIPPETRAVIVGEIVPLTAVVAADATSAAGAAVRATSTAHNAAATS